MASRRSLLRRTPPASFIGRSSVGPNNRPRCLCDASGPTPPRPTRSYRRHPLTQLSGGKSLPDHRIRRTQPRRFAPTGWAGCSSSSRLSFQPWFARARSWPPSRRWQVFNGKMSLGAWARTEGFGAKSSGFGLSFRSKPLPAPARKGRSSLRERCRPQDRRDGSQPGATSLPGRKIRC